MRALTLLLGMMTATNSLAGASYEQILHSNAEPQDWLTYSGNYAGHRYSALTQINANNVNRLKPAWVYQTDGPGKFESSPIVVDGILYLSERATGVVALDALTGRPLWSYRRSAAPDARACCGAPNRGVAILNDTLFWARWIVI